MLDTSLTPSALKKISKSVMDLSNMSEMQEISKSTSNLMTGTFFTKSVFRKRIKTIAGGATSKTCLLRSSVESLSTIEVRRARLFSCRCEISRVSSGSSFGVIKIWLVLDRFYYPLPTTTYTILPTIFFLLPSIQLYSIYYLHHFTYYLLPTIFYPLFTTFCLLPSAYYLLYPYSKMSSGRLNAGEGFYLLNTIRENLFEVMIGC